MNRKTFELMMTQLAAVWPERAPTSETTAAYWMALSHIEDGVFMRACQLCLAECTFYPKPAEIRQRVERLLSHAGVLPPSGEEAWAAVLASFGSGDSSLARHETVREAVRAIGGRERIGQSDQTQLPALRRAFLDAYEIYREKTLTQRTDLWSHALTEPDEHAGGPRKALGAG